MAGAPWGVAGYAILLSLITAFAVWCGPETYNADIGADDVEDGQEAEKPASVLVLNPAP
jgi:hypothetical protein